jgi:uncharacterized protein involved in exopolysaccharide biosynthesis
MSESGTRRPRTFGDHLETLGRRVWLLVALIVVLAAASFGLSFLQSEVYVGEARILVEPFPNNQAVNIETESEIAETAAVGIALQRDPSLAIDPKKISIRPAPQTEILIVTVDGETPQQASDVANAVAEAYVDQRNERYLGSLKAAISKIQSSIDATKQRLDSLKEISRPDAQVEQEKTRLVVRLGLLDQKMSELEPELQTEFGGGEVVVAATPPSTRSSPNPKRNVALALAVGIPMILGFFLLGPASREEAAD